MHVGIKIPFSILIVCVVDAVIIFQVSSKVADWQKTEIFIFFIACNSCYI